MSYDLIGQQFGRLTVIERQKGSYSKRVQWLCKCICGKLRYVTTYNLTSSKTQSCGCLWRENTAKGCSARFGKHRLASSRFYGVWLGMIRRCYNKRRKDFINYGARGIQVCPEWRDSPIQFIEWCEKQNPPQGYSLERMENEGDYSPSNCRFATDFEQRRNKRTNVFIDYQGQRYVLIDFVNEFAVVSRECVMQRLRRGWTIQEAAFTPRYQGLDKRKNSKRSA